MPPGRFTFTTRGSFVLIGGIFSQPFSLSKLKKTGIQSSHSGGRAVQRGGHGSTVFCQGRACGMPWRVLAGLRRASGLDGGVGFCRLLGRAGGAGVGTKFEGESDYRWAGRTNGKKALLPSLILINAEKSVWALRSHSASQILPG